MERPGLQSRAAKIALMMAAIMILAIGGGFALFCTQRSSAKLSDLPVAAERVGFLGVARKLLPVYEDPDEAIQLFKRQYPRIIDELAAEGLPEPTTENASDLLQYAIGTEKWVEDDDWNAAIDFLDILENSAANDETRRILQDFEEEVDANTMTPEEAEARAQAFLPNGL